MNYADANVCKVKHNWAQLYRAIHLPGAITVHLHSQLPKSICSETMLPPRKKFCFTRARNSMTIFICVINNSYCCASIYKKPILDGTYFSMEKNVSLNVATNHFRSFCDNLELGRKYPRNIEQWIKIWQRI